MNINIWLINQWTQIDEWINEFRRMLREDGIYETADKLEKFIIKIAIFGILYIVPVLTVIACSTYEV